MKNMAKMVVMMLMWMLSSGSLFASDETALTWSPNDPIENVTGYKIYYGLFSQSYTTSVDVGNVTEVAIAHVIENIIPGVTYYFSATAYSATSESDFASEIVWTAPILDSDGDGINDVDEASYGTDPNLADTDGDGYLDLWEIENGGDPLIADYAADSELILFEIEAESGAITAPSIAVQSASASGGYYIRQMAGGSVNYSVTVENSGYYYLLARTMVPTAYPSADTVWLTVNGNGSNAVLFPKDTLFTFNRPMLMDTGEEYTAVYLFAGVNTITIACREEGLAIDSIFIASRSDFEPMAFEIEFENGTIVAPAAIYSDAAASNGAYARLESGGKVLMPLDIIDPGKYYAWVRSRVPVENTSADTMYMSSDNGVVYKALVIPKVTNWNFNKLMTLITTTDPVSVQVSLVVGDNPYDLIFSNREAGVMGDNLVLANYQSYVAPTASYFLATEAENATIIPANAVYADADASNGTCVVTGTGGSTQVPFTLPSDSSVYIWVRGKAVGAANTMHFQIDASYKGYMTFGDTWQWVRVNDVFLTTAYALSAGGHTVVMNNREVGTLVDEVVITTDPAYVP